MAQQKRQWTRVAAYVLLTDQDRILLCRLSRPTKDWTLPGGGLNFGERPEDAAVRESLEETGYNVRITGLSSVDSNYFFY